VSGVAYLWAVVLFPDGRWPRLLTLGPRATRVLAVGVTTVAAVICWQSSFLAHPQFFVVFFGVAVSLLGVAAQLLRLSDRRAPSQDRAVARLLCGGLAPSMTVALLWLGSRGLAAAGLPGPAAFAERAQQLFPLVFAVVPAVLFVGVLRYRLWDIDRLLSRMLVYGMVTLGVGACYVAAVTAGSWFGGHELWRTGLALTLAATLIEPLRTSAGRWANRVVYGQVLTPAEAMRTLVSGLERLSAGSEVDEIAVIALAATRARSVDLWLREGDRLVRIGHAGAEGTAEPADGSTAWPISYGGEGLGVLSLDVDEGVRLAAADRVTAARIAAHAGLVVHNAQMTVRLMARVAELADRSRRLQQARRRMVAAQDDERHRLERDLHDGAQQALVAAAIMAGMLRGPVSETQRHEVAEVLDIAQTALDEVFQGARPAALGGGGLAGALQESAALAERSGLKVRVDVVGGPITDPEVEVAVYFCCVEALQNVVKHARAQQAEVSVVVADEVTFAVVDDGRGLGPAALKESTGGLLQLGSRLSLLGGTLTMESPTAGGAVVRGTVPTRAPSTTTEVPA
jgi:signal transduction histidine kinase